MFEGIGDYRFWFFDLDGTLADTDRDIRGAWKAAMADLGLVCENFDRDFVAGPPIDVMVERLFPGRCDAGLVADLRERFGAHYDHDGFPETREYPGVLAAVRRLRSAGAITAIVTNKRYVGALAMSRHFGWDDAFDGLYAGDMYKDGPIGKLAKPALLKLVMERLGAAPDECVLVGDTANDFDAARANGVKSVAVPWGYGRPDELALADFRLEVNT